MGLPSRTVLFLRLLDREGKETTDPSAANPAETTVEEEEDSEIANPVVPMATRAGAVAEAGVADSMIAEAVEDTTTEAVGMEIAAATMTAELGGMATAVEGEGSIGVVMGIAGAMETEAVEEEEEEDSVIAVVIVPIPVEVGEGEELPEAAVGLEIAEATIALVAVAGMANAVEAEEGTLEEAQVVEEWMDRLPVENALV